MTDSPTTVKTLPRPRVLRTAAGVVAGYIHELSERHRDAAQNGATGVAKAV
ncbi:MAG: hypothetical protein JO240_00365, partial [Solirubrobacterales bacterium]|nr:hypothetical protein [Solirubrobacterales bacterium]